MPRATAEGGTSGLSPVRRAWALAGVALVALPLCAQDGRGQGVSMRQPTGEIGVDFDGLWLDYTLRDDARRRTFREWLYVLFVGEVVDPQFFRFQFGFRPTLTQRNWTQLAETVDAGGDQLGLTAAVDLLSHLPVYVSARAFRWTTTDGGIFGTQSQFESTELGVRLTGRYRALPFELDYSVQSRDEAFLPTAQQLIRRDETVRTLRFSARNSKTSVIAERLAFDDRVANRDFLLYRATFGHQFRWGKRSSLASALRFLDRTGTAPLKRVSWTERVHLQHTWTVSSDYEFGMFSVRVPGDTLTGSNGRIGFTYQIDPQLQVTGEGYAEWSEFTVGRQSVYRVKPRVSYRIPLPLGGQLSLGGGVGYEWRRQVPNDAALVPAVNERHVVDASGSFLLENPFVDLASIVVTSADETVVFLDGVDYRALESASLVEIVVLPGGRILPGDTLLVDYRFRILPRARTQGVVADYSATVRVAGVTVYHRRALQDETATEGPALTLTTFDVMTTGLRVRWLVPVGGVEFHGEHRRLKTDAFTVNRFSAGSAVRVALGSRLRASAGVSAIFHRGGNLPTDLVVANASFEWGPARQVSLRSTASLWAWEDDAGRRDRFIGGGLGADWVVGQMTLQLSYDRTWRDDGLNVTEDRVAFGALRRF